MKKLIPHHLPAAVAAAQAATGSKDSAPSTPTDARERRKELLRQVQQLAILEAAETIFARDGYHAAKMADIASEAGFSAGSLYTYFKGKQEIFVSLIEMRLGELYERLDQKLAEPPEEFAEFIGILTADYAAFMDERRSFWTILNSAFPALLSGPDTEVATVALEAYQGFTLLLERIIAMGIEEGVIREDLPPRELSAMFMGMMDAVNQLWLAADPPRPFAELVPTVLDVFLNGVKQ